MPFDPTKPVDDSLAEASELRDQFNALKALYDAQQAQMAAMQSQMAAMQARWDMLTAQLADITPLGMVVSDPPTMNEVQSIVYQTDAFLAAVKAA